MEKQFFVNFCLLVFLLSSCVCFNPFMDHDLHAIDWSGSSKLEQTVNENVIVLRTTANEKYRCILPLSKESATRKDKEYDGPSPDELMEVLFTQSSCSYRIESYWTYELCHGKYLRQYHENKELNMKKGQTQEYFLGFTSRYKHKQDSADTKSVKTVDKEEKDTETEKVVDEEQKIQKPTEIKIKKIEGIDLPYFEVNMTGGTVCDLTQLPRKARLMYICQPEGRGEIFEFKETSTCEYEIIILTAVLCSNPLFKPKNPPVSKISCHALDGSPHKPSILKQWDEEDTNIRKVKFYEQLSDKKIEEEEEEEEGTAEVEKTVVPKPPKTTVKKKDTTLGETTDRNVLRGFLSGTQCLEGGGGWWKHELCFGKSVIQFHEDRDGRTEINLGYWNEQKHLQWISGHPKRRPKAKGQRKSVSLFYTDGDVCDITGQKRNVEVRLRGLVAEKLDSELFQVDTGKAEVLQPKELQTRKRKREVKPLKCHSSLEPDPRIKALRIPHNLKKETFENTEIQKLADKIKGGRKLVIEAQRQRKERQKQRQTERQLKKQLPTATYDLWGATDDNNNEDLHYMTVTKKKRVAPPKHYNKRPSGIQAIEVPHPGSSYNPTYEDHQELLWKAHEVEMKKDKKERKLYNSLEAKFKTVSAEELEANLMDEMAAGLVDDEGEDNTEFTEEELDKISVNPPVRRENKKTKTQRNKEKRQKHLEKLKKADKVDKSRASQMNRLKSLKKEILQKEKAAALKAKMRAEKEEQSKFATRKLGKAKYEEPDLELKLSDELQGSLRLLKPEGHLLADRFKSLQKRNVIEPRNIAKKSKKYKPKTFEKKGHKALGSGSGNG